ncbi:MAG: biopolymer transporter ExbD [Planctomycetota bacterium]|nr:biopolymer transporter ExbD [Planctomycetota bacterium]
MRILGKKNKRKKTDVDITPLMDVIFLLLVFFMVATSFHEESRALDVTLPRAENPKVISLDERVLSITISKDDHFFLNEDEIEPAKLREELDRKILETGFKHVLIKADAETKYRNIAAVIDVLTVLDVEGVSFAVIYTSL